MSKEEKIEWLANASGEELLAQYESSAKFHADPFKWVEFYKEYNLTYESIETDYQLVRAEMLKRMARGGEEDV